MTNLNVYNFIMNPEITVCFESEYYAETAQQFAAQHSLNIKAFDSITSLFTLYYRGDHVELIDNQNHTAIHVDFLSGSLAHRRQYGGGKGQSIAKAIGIKQYKLPLNIIDATAGLAKDAFVLACLGCSITLVERSPIVAELVKSAILHAENSEAFQTIKQQGFELVNQNAVNYLENLNTKTDIIYLDPMYPERKKSAAVKKNMQLLQKLLGQDNDTNALLEIALQKARKRVVVKRPKGAPTLSDKKPSMTIESKITRYDVYVLT